MEFMRDGGINMWVMVFAAIGAVVMAGTRDAKDRPVVLLGGCIVSLILAVFGISTGLQAVAAGYSRFPDQLAALAMGLRELSNNGLLGGVLATVLGLAAYVTRSNLKHTA